MKRMTFRAVNGTHYDSRAAEDVIKVLEEARMQGQRIRIFYGDPANGYCTMEPVAHIGYVERTDGDLKRPVLRVTENSKAKLIFDKDIVRILARRRVWVANGKGGRYEYRWEEAYRHPNFHLPPWEIVEQKLDCGGVRWVVRGEHMDVAKFMLKTNAERYLKFVRGEIQTLAGRS